MQRIRAGMWIVAFALAFTVICSGAEYAGKGLDMGMNVVLVLLGFALIIIVLLLSGVVVWLYKDMRPFYVEGNLFFLLIILLFFACYLFSRASFPEDLEKVKAFVSVAAPALERYYEQHGHYPDTLGQLDLELQAPAGLVYRHVFDPGHRWVESSPRHRGGEIYLIDFSNAHYCGDGHWFVD